MKNLSLVCSSSYRYFCSRYNASKEAQAPSATIEAHQNPQAAPQVKTTPKVQHDDFSDLVDYLVLNSDERERHRELVSRVSPVIQKSGEGDLVKVGNPTLGDLKKLKIR